MLFPVQPTTISQRTILNISHRGNSSAAPENTLAAFDCAVASGSQMIETDLRLTRDGVTVLFHDAVLGRTVSGPVRQLAGTLWKELEDADAGSWFGAGFAHARVPTLRDLTDWSQANPGPGLLLEFKGEWTAAALKPVTAALRAAGMTARCMVQGFSRTTVLRLQECAPDIPRALLLSDAPGTPAGRSDLAAFLDSAQAAACNPSGDALLADPSLVRFLQDNGQVVFAWTLNRRVEWIQAAEAGVDGIVTDRPEALHAWQMAGI